MDRKRNQSLGKKGKKKSSIISRASRQEHHEDIYTSYDTILPIKFEENKEINIKSSWEDVIRGQYGYYFNDELCLRSIENNQPFKFIDQTHYDILGDIILNYIQEKLVSFYNLDEVQIPLAKHYNGSNKCNIFHSKDWFSNRNKGLILIQGTGAVRAGQWARSVCINDSLNIGAVFPFLEEAFKGGYSTIILNPNYNENPETRERIPFNGDSDEHSDYVWENFIRPCPARELYIVAHSRGGASTIHLLEKYWKEFNRRVKAIAFTDAALGSVKSLNMTQKAVLAQIAVDWIESRHPRDHLEKPAAISRSGVTNLSSGHEKHEYTTGYAFPSIFPFFRNKQRFIH
ncbi:unnamed protein product [Blepharisma stoltei]|uniref:Arb2 domain-containing protein n=1 Tax=Blepharisma stoltei TaxID=1481888 RepID=A0AAU9IWS0_9CILI|nr:unnamed protein product [Blepharisma stoltei]